MTTPPLPEQIELHRDRMWRRDEDLRVESAVDAERFIEDVGSANTLDARRAGPSFRIAVSDGDVSFPRSHSETGRRRQKDERDAPHLVPQGRNHAPKIIETGSDLRFCADSFESMRKITLV